MNPLDIFCERYGLTDKDRVAALYDVIELLNHLPEQPSEEEKKVLQSLIGVKGESAYLDYAKNNNSFELIMQWREKTGNF